MADKYGAVVPTVKVDGSELDGKPAANLIKTVVDTHLHLPGMFELTFREDSDERGGVLGEAGIKIGSVVKIEAGEAESSGASVLIEGEVTAIEGNYNEMVAQTIVRGYDKSHRLHRGRKTKAWANKSDSDIARTVASGARLTVG
ncbi:MAG: VgrG-related protein, partial [Acidimicrobiales bacterium]